MAPVNRILLCYGATPEGRHALRFDAALAQQLQAETHLLSIFDYTYLSSGFDVLSSMKFEVDEQAAQESLRTGVDWLRAWDVTATRHYSVGNAIDRISHLAESLKIDLIVLGHHPHSFLRAGERRRPRITARSGIFRHRVQGDRQTACVSSNWAAKTALLNTRSDEGEDDSESYGTDCCIGPSASDGCAFRSREDLRGKTSERILRHMAGRHRRNRTRHET